MRTSTSSKGSASAGEATRRYLPQEPARFSIERMADDYERIYRGG